VSKTDTLIVDLDHLFLNHTEETKWDSSPKTEKSVINYSPSRCTKPVNVLFCCITIFIIDYHIDYPPLTTIVFFSYYGSEWGGRRDLLGYRHSSKHLPLYSSRTKKCIQVWNNLRVRKWWKNFNLGVNNPFKLVKTQQLLQVCHREYPSYLPDHCLVC